MTRVKRGSIARKRRTKIRLFTSSFRGAHSKLTRTISQQKIKDKGGFGLSEIRSFSQVSMELKY